MVVRYVLLVCFCLVHFKATSASSDKRIVTVYRGSPDAVKNDVKKSSICEQYGLHCLDNSCRECQCPHERANYVVSKGLCFSNREVQQETNANCQYTLGAPHEPIALLKLTTENGSRPFHDDHSSSPNNLAVCNHTITADHWYHLDAHGKWRLGDDKNFFNVKYKYLTVGPERNEYLLTDLQWHGKLSAQYGGVLIKVSLTCDSREIGCVLVKSDGTKQYDTTNVPTPATQVPLPTTPPEIPTTKYIDGNNPTTPDNSNTKYGKQKQGSSSNAALAPALGVVGVLLFVMALSCVAVMLHRRRQKRRNNKPWRNPETDSVANLNDFAEPIYAEVNKGADDFDNPVYSDPALDEQNKRSAHLGPLPAIPGTETAYQPLSSLTRQPQDSDIKDYENPVDGVPPSEDYDNPPAGFADIGKGASDYDNPPAQGIPEKTSDYDNPPTVGVGENTPEKNDYDVPKTADQSDCDNGKSVDTQF